MTDPHIHPWRCPQCHLTSERDLESIEQLPGGDSEQRREQRIYCPRCEARSPRKLWEKVEARHE